MPTNAAAAILPSMTGSMTTGPGDQEQPATTRPADRWWARLAFLLAGAAVVLLLVGAGFASIALVLLWAAALATSAAGLWWFLTSRHRLRALLAASAVLAPVVVLVICAFTGLLWEVIITVVLAVGAGVAGRAALAHEVPSATMPERDVAPPTRPFVIMNPRSGGGKVERFGLAEKAATLGAEVCLLDVDHQADVAALAHDAVARGADLLGVAGGDGTQALVAAVAAEHGVPLMVISAGTRNHFALDLGLDRTDPSRCLDALADGVELRVDLGEIGGRPFVNNASFGAYAEIVRDPAYRDDKVRVTLQRLPDLLLGQREGRLHAIIDGGHRLDSPQAVLVSNNPYETEDIAGLSRRARLDTGRLGVAAVRVANARQAVGLLSRAHAEGVTLCTATEVVVDAAVPQVPVGIDGEAVLLPAPMRCIVRPGGLRVRVPRNRPGVPPPRAAVDWSRLRRLAFGRGALDVPERLESQLDAPRWRPVRPRRPSEPSPVDRAAR